MVVVVAAERAEVISHSIQSSLSNVWIIVIKVVLVAINSKAFENFYSTPQKISLLRIT